MRYSVILATVDDTRVTLLCFFKQKLKPKWLEEEVTSFHANAF